MATESGMRSAAVIAIDRLTGAGNIAYNMKSSADDRKAKHEFGRISTDVDAAIKVLRESVAKPAAVALVDDFAEQFAAMITIAGAAQAQLREFVSVVSPPPAWRPIYTAPRDRDVLCLDIRTGRRAISGYEDRGDRRGFRHRNGFPATHWADLLESLPIDASYDPVDVKLEVLAYLREECARGGPCSTQHDGCSCSDGELLKRVPV